MDNGAFEAARILNGLQIDPREFGYRAQALLAETLAQLGVSIDAVARTGHPDITARISGQLLRIQVKSTRQTSFSIGAKDIEGIRPQGESEEGYLSVLDLGPPMRWIFIPYSRARVLVDRVVPLAMLRSMEHVDLSSQCTEGCAQLVRENQTSIEAFTFSLLSKRALNLQDS